jgi:hypothetical protein
MTTLPVVLDDELDAALEAACARQGLSKADLVTNIVRRYVETERLKRTSDDPDLEALYQQLAAEDVALAEEGLAAYRDMLDQADQPFSPPAPSWATVRCHRGED